ncbi:MAG: PVC-type heme-binding CxxCH protein [Isosphaeraceae bacterium]
MKVPPGFKVEVVASEPDLVNPVAMTFDERGRIWVTESLEYPRRSPGPGRDRVKVLEDQDGDGKVDSVSIFAEGLNIPSGIAVGHGGVWVANSPDILFLQDTDGDGRADRKEVVVTGFGRDDTHELPNSLTWGPDGWLYGWNGVFNKSHVVYRGKTYDFTCAVFRIHPRTREFQLYCEGTSNPWGITWNEEGSAFASACVIDHLWHLTESGYYHRQGGAYPPHTWKIGSIVDHLHQKAAYCGIHYYDSDAYPAAYRGKLFMGNIHGNCVNVDSLSRTGSTYKGTPAPDFLTANDSWFMPVAQKTGPDGSIYILDWYDRYHCYQDANRDPAGIDRLKGRLYRVRYGETPRRSGFDLSRESDTRLIELLGSATSYDRETARRLLSERSGATTDAALTQLVFDTKRPRRTRLNAFWTLIGRDAVSDSTLVKLFDENDAVYRAWGVRAAGNRHQVGAEVVSKLRTLASDPSADVRLQVAIAATKVVGLDAIPVLVEVASAPGDDPLIPQIVWQNLHPTLEEQGGALLAALSKLPEPRQKSPALRAIVPRSLERVLARSEPDMSVVGGLFARVVSTRPTDREAGQRAIEALTAKLGSSSGQVDSSLRDAIERALREEPNGPLAEELSLLRSFWQASGSREVAERILLDGTRAPEMRLRALAALRASAGEQTAIDRVAQLLKPTGERSNVAFRGRVISALGVFQSREVAPMVLALYTSLEAENRPRAVELLTQRAEWARLLLGAIGKNAIEPTALNINQVRRLLSLGDPELAKLIKERWGVLREGRDTNREQVVDSMRRLVRSTPGDPHAGAEVFRRLCAQCHKIYGDGQEVGPEITLNGRASLDQLLSNVFDPSLVIGAGYQATTLATTDGRVISGLLVEDSPTRVVLKIQGGKLETIPRGQVDEMKLSALSLMPEDVERQLKPQEIADLFSFLSLDRPPSDPQARSIPGAETLRRERRPR